MNDPEFGDWKELLKRKEQFQEMVAMLVDFDERTGRHRRFGEPEQHFFRKAVVSADPNDLRIFMQKIRGYVYYVVVELRTPGGFCATSWLHEDGVQLERDQMLDEPDHPVHGVDCLSDFFRKHSLRLPEDFEEIDLNANTLDIMLAEINWRRPPFVA